MDESTSIVWFKNDLRLHDNESLCKAIAFGQPILPIFIFDERLFNLLELGFRKADYNRFQFLKESVLNLQDNLKNIGGKLFITSGLPEEIIPKLVSKYNVSSIYAEDEYADEEKKVLSHLVSNLSGRCELILTWGKTLYHINDLPYSIETIPMTSKAYRINTTKNSEIRQPFLAPDKIQVISKFPASNLPKAVDFDFDESAELKPLVSGGETAALKRLHYYTFETQQLTGYRWSRNRSLGMDYSSKFSPYLALGCISPRLIHQKIKLYETLVTKNQSTWWIIFEIIWRDFFTFKGMRVGDKMFKPEGFKSKDRKWQYNSTLFKKWCSGNTGLPFIDAHMRQLNTTGFMSNRGRVNCSSFLIHDYKIDWTWGAAYFESKLIDYDVSSNWMNWHYQAYEIWYTNPVNQSLKYKSQEFIRKWIPEIAKLNDVEILIPWEFQVSNYPQPVEIMKKWSRAINKIKRGNDDN